MYILCFAIALFIKVSSGLQKDSLFLNDSFFNGKSCKNQMVFKSHCLGAIHCAVICKNNASCYSFFYNNHSKKCTGCMMVYEQIEQRVLVPEQGSAFFYEFIEQTNSHNLTTPETKTKTAIQLITETTSHIHSRTEATRNLHPTTTLLLYTMKDIPRLTTLINETTRYLHPITDTTRNLHPITDTTRHLQPMTDATSIPRVVWDPDNIPIYILQEKMVYRAAKGQCVGMGQSIYLTQRMCNSRGHLAIVESPAENEFLGKKLTAEGVDYAYIGMTILNGKLVIDFQDSQKAVFTNNLEIDSNGSCIMMNAVGKWTSVSCIDEFISICETD